MKNLYKIEDELYIISDNENINENDYIITKDDRLVQVSYLLSKDLEGASKVILSTNALLIKDGVQSIDDDFLEWFVKNPSCEFINVYEKTPDEIEVELNIHGHDIGLTDREFDEWLNNGGQLYKIIISKEEPKQDRTCTNNCSVVCGECQILESKQETLEEAAERLYPTTINSFTDSGFDMSETERLIFINGAKWQQERMYSEEEVRKMFSRYNEVIAHRDVEEWQPWIDKQFKKK